MDNIPDLLRNQRKNIKISGNYGKMSFYDIKRFDKYTGGNVFGDDCVKYYGDLKDYKTSIFSYRGKKVSLYRLLYHNFIGDINRRDKLCLECPNKPLCCNINHIKKYDC